MDEERSASRQGTVMIDRGILNHSLFEPAPFTEREAWIWMIMEASWRERSIYTKRGPVQIKRGQFTSSVRFMADKFQWSKSRVSRFVNRLVDQKMIGTASGTGQNVVTVCNYDIYQDFMKYSGTASGTPLGTASGTPTGQSNTAEHNGFNVDKEFKRDSNRDTGGTNKNTFQTPSSNGGGGNAREENFDEILNLQNEIMQIVQPIANDKLRTAFIRGDQSQLAIVPSWLKSGPNPEQIIEVIRFEVDKLSSQGKAVSSLNYFQNPINRLSEGQHRAPHTRSQNPDGEGLTGIMESVERNLSHG